MERIFHKRDMPLKRHIIDWLLEQAPGTIFTFGDIESAITGLISNGKSIKFGSVRDQVMHLKREGYLTEISLSPEELEELSNTHGNKSAYFSSVKRRRLNIDSQGQGALRKIVEKWDDIIENSPSKSIPQIRELRRSPTR